MYIKFSDFLKLSQELKKYDSNEIDMGMVVEMEHFGKQGEDVSLYPIDNNGGPIVNAEYRKEEINAMVLKIVLAHLREDPRYYTKLKNAGL